MTIHNYGFKRIQFGYRYEIYRQYENDTIVKIEFPDNYQWNEAIIETSPMIGSFKQQIYTSLNVGDYFIKKNFTIIGFEEFSKTVNFSVR
jgi:hypothetical protein